MSDLHLETSELDPLPGVPDADVCVVAGDLCRGVAKGIAFMADLLGGRMPCVLVAGNHEFWGSSIEQEILAGRDAASRHQGMFFLQDESVVIRGVRFIGATLWTDFGVFGNRRLAMIEARQRMRDYRRICLSKRPWTRFTPEVSTRLHARSLSFIAAAVEMTEPSVIVTHHAPHPNSLPSSAGRQTIDAAYASDLEGTICSAKPALWVHGHTHHACDYAVGQTRIVSNPRGYPSERLQLDQGWIVEV